MDSLKRRMVGRDVNDMEVVVIGSDMARHTEGEWLGFRLVTERHR